jgi:hypothetical protein
LPCGAPTVAAPYPVHFDLGAGVRELAVQQLELPKVEEFGQRLTERKAVHVAAAGKPCFVVNDRAIVEVEQVQDDVVDAILFVRQTLRPIHPGGDVALEYLCHNR